MRVLRVSHSASNPAHRRRDHALAAAGAGVTVVLPAQWPEGGDPGLPAGTTRDGALTLHALAAARCGDVNRHRYLEGDRLTDLLCVVAPEVVDLHEEPCSVATRQWLAAARAARVPAVLYTAQNLDKRYPPPFAQYETAALRAAAGVYPCSRQAASVVRGKGFRGPVEVLPLGYDAEVFTPGDQSLDATDVVLGLVGRLVPEKGVVDAVEVLAAVQRLRPARLVVIGDGPELAAARERAVALGVADRLDVVGWVSAPELASWYRRMHVVLVPSRSTSRWTEQFGRVIVEGRASGAVVAAYDSGAIGEVVGEAGVLVGEGDVDALAAATAGVVGDAAAFDELRDAGRRASGGLTWTAVARRQLDFYATCLAAEGRRAVPEARQPVHEARRTDAGPRRERPADSRRRARAEFGAPAVVPGQERPFALPVLRDRPRLGRVLGGLVDATRR